MLTILVLVEVYNTWANYNKYRVYDGAWEEEQRVRW